MSENPFDSIPVPMKQRWLAAQFEYGRALKRLQAVVTEVREFLTTETREQSDGAPK